MERKAREAREARKSSFAHLRFFAVFARSAFKRRDHQY
jgi:hypothetical protein